jgi:hypothetical protein
MNLAPELVELIDHKAAVDKRFYVLSKFVSVIKAILLGAMAAATQLIVMSNYFEWNGLSIDPMSSLRNAFLTFAIVSYFSFRTITQQKTSTTSRNILVTSLGKPKLLIAACVLVFIIGGLIVVSVPRNYVSESECRLDNVANARVDHAATIIRVVCEDFDIQPEYVDCVMSNIGNARTRGAATLVQRTCRDEYPPGLFDDLIKDAQRDQGA